MLDRQLQKSERGRDDLVLGAVAAQRDELEVRVHSGFVEEEDASLKKNITSNLCFIEVVTLLKNNTFSNDGFLKLLNYKFNKFLF